MYMGIHMFTCTTHSYKTHANIHRKKIFFHPIAHCVTLGQVFVPESLCLGDPRKYPNLEPECEELANHSDGGPDCVVAL